MATSLRLSRTLGDVVASSRCPDSVLLFPFTPGVTGKQYTAAGELGGESLRVELIDLSCDLLRERARFAEGLRAALVPRGAGLAEREVATA